MENSKNILHNFEMFMYAKDSQAILENWILRKQELSDDMLNSRYLYKFHIIFTTCKIFFDFIPIVAYFFLKKVFRKWESNWKINNQYQYLHGFCGWKWTELYKAYQKCSLIWQFFYSVQWSVCVLYLVEMNLWLRHKASRHRCSMEIKWRQQ